MNIIPNSGLDPFVFAGFWFYVQAKGYNPAWALLFFIFGPLAVLVFFCLPDREHQKAEGTSTLED